MSTSTSEKSKQFGLPDLPDGVFYPSLKEAVKDSRLNGQVHYMRRAFKEMKLDGILCIDGKPTVYLKDFKRPVTRRQVNELHQKFWNQGTATLLVVQDPQNVYIFSGMVLPSNEDGDVKEHAALVEPLDRVANTLEAHRLVERVASGHYYRENLSKFNARNAVDQCLLDDLEAVGDALCHKRTVAERKRVHGLLGRIIFTCYLIDREIILFQDYPFITNAKVHTFLDLLREYPPERARNLLYDKLFPRLRTDFNGSMFDEELAEEKESLSDGDICTLRDFLAGEGRTKGQRLLGFWAYDFSVIPVETISAIYEKFLEQEDADDKEATGAFYTPKHLAEMVVAEAVASFDTLLDKKYLDPACGSGVFLVILFNRLAEEWRRNNPRAQETTRAGKLLGILHDNLCGVDVNRTACRIACFSLYVAFLDQFPSSTLRELQERTKKLLPKLLAYKNEGYANTDTPAIFEGNFFDPGLLIASEFDVVLGNPPWVGRNQPSDKQVETWVFSEEHNPWLRDAPKGKSERTAIFLPQTQVAHAFMWKTPLHVTDGGCVSLLLPSEVLLNQTDAFQESWFTHFTVDRISHLADFRKFLFAGARRPCFIASYRTQTPDPASHQVEYVVPKVRRQDPRSGLIPVSPQDRKWIALDQISEAAKESQCAILWKTYLWGTPRDLRFVEYLLGLDELRKIVRRIGRRGESDDEKRKPWTIGQGFQPYYSEKAKSDADYPKPKKLTWPLSDPFIETRKIPDLFLIADDCITLGERLNRINADRDNLRRAPEDGIFEPPLVLVNEGFNRFAFSEFRVRFQDAVRSISAPEDHSDILLFFTIFVGSKLARYFQFHTAGSWGTERDVVRLHELLRLPFPLPGSPHTASNAKTIVREVAKKVRDLRDDIKLQNQRTRQEAEEDRFQLQATPADEERQRRLRELQRALEPFVYRYFDLSDEEIALVEDTCEVYERSSTPATPESEIDTLRKTNVDFRLNYTSYLCETLNEWSRIDQPKGKRQPFYFYAESCLLERIGMALVSIRKSDHRTDCADVSANTRTEKALGRIAEATTEERGAFQYLRGIIFGDGQSIRILKPDLLGQWTKTSALNDADTVFHAIIQAKRRRK